MIFVIIFILLVIITILLFVFGMKFFILACKKDDKSIIKNIEKHNIDLTERIVDANVEWFKEMDIKDLYIKSNDGLKLHATYLAAPNPYRTVICVHGYRAEGISDFSNIVRYLNMNHSNVLIIDQRACGESEGDFITFGAKEKEDLKLWIETVVNKIDDKVPIYLYGISMGATTSLLTLEYKLPFQVKGVIADSAYTSMNNVFDTLLSSWFHLPGFPIINIINMYCGMIAHFNMDDTNTAKALKENEIPVMFIHGEKDTFVSPENTRTNYALTKGAKEILWIPEANHAEAILKDPNIYHAKLEYFFDTYK